MSNLLKRKLKLDENSAIETKIKKIKSNTIENCVDLIYINHENRLREEFFNKKCLDLSKHLLNKYLVRKLDDSKYLIGKIVEVEAYLGGSDRASHTYNNKQTDRLKAMYMPAGTAYVYNIYGIYCCLNVSSQEPGAGVLIRALEPVHGFDQMRLLRNLDETKNAKHLANGPSKLCIAMNITKNLFNQIDLAKSKDMWLQEPISAEIKTADKSDLKIVSCKRIGIDYAGEEAMNKLYRFYIQNNVHVSVKSKSEIILTDN
jgi:DNA-3-methyladenine glycosylase